MMSIQTPTKLLTSICALWTIFVLSSCNAFQSPSPYLSSTRTTRRLSSSTLLRDTSQVEEVLGTQYPIFTNLIMSKNADMWKKLSDASNEGFTIFAPNDDAMKVLGDKKLTQLGDDRNGETAEKIATFHAIEERVTADELYNSGGVITLGGVIDVGRSKTGGFMGIGGQEDGGVTINGAKILQSFEVGNSFVHEVDGLVSPDILWRYVDQLRIPGSS